MRQKIILSLLAAAATFQSCIKTKVENALPILSVLNNSSSSIRLFNFSVSNLDITVNNYPLTSYTTATSTGGTTLGQSLFPSGVWPSSAGGSPFTLPNSLLDKNGQAHIHLQPRGSAVALVKAIDTVLQDNQLNPTDYYIEDKQPYIMALPRINTPPARAQDFKIRIINKGQSGDALGLYGPVTLTYADGTPVSPLTSNIGPDSTSSYVELPYGAYEFKLFASTGLTTIDPTKQLAELPIYPNLDPCGSYPPQEGIFPLVRTLKPGGDYSAVITSNYLSYFDCNNRQTSTPYWINAYRLVTELNPGTNITFARMQGVNALSPSSPISIQVDGQLLGKALGFGQPSDYAIFIQGTHEISVLDAQGNTLVQKPITLYPYDNYCLWAYPDANGNPAIDFDAVDITGTTFTSSNTGYINDGSNGSASVFQVPYPWETRFLNLAPDLPYATFTNDSILFTTNIYNGDSAGYSAASINMTPGYLPSNNPYVLYSREYFAAWANPPYSLSGASIPPQVIRAYASTPGPEAQVPGTLLQNVQPLTTMQFIANPALYTSGIPYAEPGAYTAALIGKVSAPVGDPAAARLIVIKHNK